ncbi:MAG TPA: response regulator transcription factor [Phycisphaerae bacterium]|nr:response regulator transcription factor [Phycisphaerae bacterium]HOJ75632.1 response regulator transcription factor [Phycisphaerae bacterium]HOM52500.1 response regulator transcription factor [Phycisphaerae bacterium]HON65357.1 response regulator transcription factor [Phycisphaerae bacterium]HOQ85342.1 response regulator transcription factor [Phycisphaerae bacterium]
MSGRTVLIVEDDVTLSRVLADNFAHEQYVVHTAADGESGLHAARRLKPDLIVLDIMLPYINGYEVCRLLRRDGLEMPILMLTAKSLENDIVLGLDVGADDYVTKPFSIRELLARAAALLRRSNGHVGVKRFGEFTLDLSSHKLLRDGREVVLTPKEFAVLALLARKPGRAFTREQILQSVWGDALFVTVRSVDRCITTLRKKIEANPREPRFIRTVREIGYRLEESWEL